MEITKIKVFADTNIFVSSIINPLSLPHLALEKAKSLPFCLYTSHYCFDELREVFLKKFPNKIKDLNKFLRYEFDLVTILDDFDDSYYEENLIRDPKDRLILRSSIKEGIDFILTGDKDFLESGLTHPLPVTPRDFLDKY